MIHEAGMVEGGGEAAVILPFVIEAHLLDVGLRLGRILGIKGFLPRPVNRHQPLRRRAGTAEIACRQQAPLADLLNEAGDRHRVRSGERPKSASPARVRGMQAVERELVRPAGR